MPDPSRLSIFLLASLVLLLTPGPSVLYIVARSLDQGRLAGFVSVLRAYPNNLLDF
jgi:threonine/homoserine/homoserine lactone efflux protein